jgi:hypothetical protein
MHDPVTNTITFPHVIPGTKLGDEIYTYDHIDGGMKKLADLGLEAAYFLGGNVDVLGFVTKLGLYLCPNRWSKQIMAFYVHDPLQLTPMGVKLVVERFPTCTVNLETYRERMMTVEDFARRDAIRQQAIEFGIAVEQVSTLNANELLGLMAAVKSGESGKKIGAVESAAETPVNKKTEHVAVHVSGKPSRNTKI